MHSDDRVKSLNLLKKAMGLEEEPQRETVGLVVGPSMGKTEDMPKILGYYADPPEEFAASREKFPLFFCFDNGERVIPEGMIPRELEPVPGFYDVEGVFRFFVKRVMELENGSLLKKRAEEALDA